MSQRANIFGRLRRWNARSARPILALFAVAYVAAGAAPCAAAPSREGGAAAHDHTAATHEGQTAAHESHAAHHQQVDAAAHSQHGHEDHGGAPPDAHDTAPAPAQPGSHCPHCPAALGGIAHGNDHASCAALDDVSDVAAAHAKDSSPPLAIPFVLPAFTLPPSLASPRAAPQSRAARIPSVPLNVRYCVFLI